MRRRKSKGNQGRSDRTVNQDTKDCRKIKGGNMDNRERAGKMLEILRKSGNRNAGEPSRRALGWG